MKGYLKICTVLLAAFFLVQCSTKTKSPLKGIWKLQAMEINDTEMNGASLGGWLWEFNNKGGYLVMVAGEKEKGRYTLKDHKLTMKSETHAEKPEAQYNVLQLDSGSLRLVSVGGENSVKLFFAKTDNGIEEDD